MKVLLFLGEKKELGQRIELSEDRKYGQYQHFFLKFFFSVFSLSLSRHSSSTVMRTEQPEENVCIRSSSIPPHHSDNGEGRKKCDKGQLHDLKQRRRMRNGSMSKNGGYYRLTDGSQPSFISSHSSQYPYWTLTKLVFFLTLSSPAQLFSLFPLFHLLHTFSDLFVLQTAFIFGTHVELSQRPLSNSFSLLERSKRREREE